MIKSQHYYNRYLKFIDYAKSLNLEYARKSNFERHHIIPRSHGGTDDESNLIVLTARMHYLAHWMMWRAYRTGSMAQAFQIMANTRSGVRISARLYEKLRIEANINRSEKLKGRPGHNKGKPSPMRGYKHGPAPEERKRRQSLASKGKNALPKHIIQAIYDTNGTIEEIAKQFGVSRDSVTKYQNPNRIRYLVPKVYTPTNEGKACIIDGIEYPTCKAASIVYKFKDPQQVSYRINSTKEKYKEWKWL